MVSKDGLLNKRIVEEIKTAKKYEKDITKYLKTLCKKYNGALMGLKYKFKNPKKVMSKLKRKGYDYELRDILRYTIVIPTDKYTRGVYDIFTDLMNNNIYKTKHNWIKQQWCLGDMYQGINTSWEYNGEFIFELQFHTHESFKAKTEGVLHELYDTYNLNNCGNIYIDDKKYIEYKCRKNKDQMVVLEDKIPIPSELDNANCGYGIEEWYKILGIPSKLKGSLKKDKAKRKGKTSKKSKTRRKSNTRRKSKNKRTRRNK